MARNKGDDDISGLSLDTHLTATAVGDGVPRPGDDMPWYHRQGGVDERLSRMCEGDEEVPQTRPGGED